jgi:hypothetical protein
MSIVLLGSTSGSCTLQEQAVAGTTVLTLPTTSGTVMVNGPAFSAYQSSSQALAISTATKILYQTEQFDTDNNFASSRFTPTVAGYYQISCAASFGGAASIKAIVLYKNGSAYRAGIDASTTQTSMSSLIYFNGSTDYVEVYITSTTAVNSDAIENRTWFCGALVRGA